MSGPESVVKRLPLLHETDETGVNQLYFHRSTIPNIKYLHKWKSGFEGKSYGQGMEF